jgi:trehalose 6-phosphate synthase/phosphatase
MRLVIVSNRLPVTVNKTKAGFEYAQSAGGLATGIQTFLKSKDNYIWVGWPGSSIAQEDRIEVNRTLQKKYHAYPVYVDDKLMDKFYLGFCNKTIWPLFHYFPGNATYLESNWRAYEEVNSIFARELSTILKPGDMVWVHDYHLMLLPMMLRKDHSHKIGFFLHIPFPSFEVFRLMPPHWRAIIIDGILGADLVGFHTHDYREHFLRTVLRLTGREHDMGNIFLEDRIVRVEALPMGIDYEQYSSSGKKKSVQRQIEGYRKTFGKSKVILSLDRLDYTKGILNRLRGYQSFLKSNPDWYGKVVLVAVVVPSRVEIEHYKDMKRTVEELVSRINGKFATLEWAPIIYQYKSYDFDDLCALYRVSDIALVTPLRDGMNLIAKEYIATHSDGTGVLILSEMAGAVHELGEAIIINPNSSINISHAIKEALTLSPAEQKARNNPMHHRLARYDIRKWGNDFIAELQEVTKLQEDAQARFLGQKTRKQILAEYRQARKRLIFLDYDGTLVPFASRPGLALPSKAVMTLLDTLASDDANSIVLISGRDKKWLDALFSHTDVSLIAEHGVWEKTRLGWVMNKTLKSDWIPSIRQILELYVDRVPGSFIEEKEFSIAWHYRAAGPSQGTEMMMKLLDELVMYTANHDLQVLKGNKVVEVRNAGINKGTAALPWLSRKRWGFIMAIGDDQSDEDLFHVLPPEAFSIKVGLGNSKAKYNLKNIAEVHGLLGELSRQKSTKGLSEIIAGSMADAAKT